MLVELSDTQPVVLSKADAMPENGFQIFLHLVITVTISCVLVLSFAPVTVAGSIAGSKHDLSSLDKRAGTGAMGDVAFENFQQSCVYCHTPHVPAGSPSTGKAPLWNRDYPVTSYYPYQSPTMDVTSRQPSGVSLACLSCHDGTLAVDRVIKRPAMPGKQKDPHRMKIARGGSDDSCSQCHRSGKDNISGIHDLGISAFGNQLGDDHPVSINYPGKLKDPQFHPQPENGVFANGVRLFSGRVECASCHDVHSPDHSPFLRAGVEGSALCLTCHAK